jgi:hypothetical protein
MSIEPGLKSGKKYGDPELKLGIEQQAQVESVAFQRVFSW